MRGTKHKGTGAQRGLRWWGLGRAQNTDVCLEANSPGVHREGGAAETERLGERPLVEAS